jgi:hypothetical protein
MTVFIQKPKLWLGVRSVKSYEASASFSNQKVKVYCDSANMSYNETTGAVSIEPKVVSVYENASKTVLGASSASTDTSILGDGASVNSPVFTVPEATQRIRFTFSIRSTARRGTTQPREVGPYYFYPCHFDLNLYQNGSLVKTISSSGAISNVHIGGSMVYESQFLSQTLDYYCNLAPGTTANFYATFKSTRSSTQDVTIQADPNILRPGIWITASWSNVQAYLPESIPAEGTVNYCILDNYLSQKVT